MSNGDGPLRGYRILEACQMIAGPLAATLLADLGAEVIKIEAPKGGDRMRFLGHRIGSIGALWAGVNRGKRSVVVDLQRSEGVDVLRKLIAKTDVFIQNFRPGVVDRLGIDEASLRSINPELIYVSVSGFGDSGPYADQKTYDYVVQALSGMAALQTDPSTGDPSLIRNFVIDKVTANTACQAILAALLARSGGAGGQHVQVSMLDAGLAFLWPDGMMQHSLLDTGAVVPGPHMADNYLVRRTADGHLALMAYSERQFPGLCRALGKPEWLDDPRFISLTDRDANTAALNDLVAAEIETHNGAELVGALHAQDVPCAMITPVERVHLDPQVQHNSSVVEHVRPHLGRVREARPPARFSQTPTSLGRHAPKLDEHTDEVLLELGFNTAAIVDLRARAIVGPQR